MELKKLSEHIWYMPFEEERDRPNLGYVKGEKMSLAIDAGHSEAHLKEFYDLLQNEGLTVPSIT
ncbi:MAG: MBL fold metallo-hydrolase, partial [Clostridiales bacterium]|nr:MBL fold metallo-hydrolase [Clostridiales bacterium]